MAIRKPRTVYYEIFDLRTKVQFPPMPVVYIRVYKKTITVSLLICCFCKVTEHVLTHVSIGSKISNVKIVMENNMLRIPTIIYLLLSNYFNF